MFKSGQTYEVSLYFHYKLGQVPSYVLVVEARLSLMLSQLSCVDVPRRTMCLRLFAKLPLIQVQIRCHMLDSDRYLLWSQFILLYQSVYILRFFKYIPHLLNSWVFSYISLSSVSFVRLLLISIIIYVLCDCDPKQLNKNYKDCCS